jgi:hypothetical protein
MRARNEHEEEARRGLLRRSRRLGGVGGNMTSYLLHNGMTTALDPMGIDIGVRTAMGDGPIAGRRLLLASHGGFLG